MSQFHTHLLLKGEILNPPKNEEVLKKWMENLVSKINMKILSGPHVNYLDVAGNRGISGLVMIETSHCSIHIWDETSPALVQMDVYSCANFDSNVVIACLSDFDLVNYHKMRIDRNNTMFISEG